MVHLEFRGRNLHYGHYFNYAHLAELCPELKKRPGPSSAIADSAPPLSAMPPDPQQFSTPPAQVDTQTSSISTPCGVRLTPGETQPAPVGA